MPDVHSRFSPSASERLIRCPPSLKLGEEYGPEDASSDFAREGTEAHSLCEYLLRTSLGETMEDPRPGFHYYSPEMQECAEGYRDEVLAIYETLRQTCKDPVISVEQQVHFDEYVPGGFGTSDCVILGDGHMFVIDYKHGIGVPVSAEDNSQLKCYALGAYLAFSPLYEITDISLVVYQPRLSNYSHWELTVESLLDWAETVLKPQAGLALAGGGEYACGEWCRFCKAKAVCRKRAEENMALARYDFKNPGRLDDDEINTILGKVDRLVAWAGDVKDYALKKAVGGYAWSDWKLVEGRSTRKYTDETKVAETVAAAGYDPYEKKLLSITAMEKLLGKQTFASLLGSMVVKPEGKPVLVPKSDKRPEKINPRTDFEKETES